MKLREGWHADTQDEVRFQRSLLALNAALGAGEMTGEPDRLAAVTELRALAEAADGKAPAPGSE